MKKLKRPTMAQKKLMQKWKLDPAVWMVERDTSTELHLVHRHSDKTKRIIQKGESQ